MTERKMKHHVVNVYVQSDQLVGKQKFCIWLMQVECQTEKPHNNMTSPIRVKQCASRHSV